MIRSFRHRALRRMYERGDPSRISSDLADRAAPALADLDNARKPSDLDLPGYRLFDNGGAYDIDLIDYH